MSKNNEVKETESQEVTAVAEVGKVQETEVVNHSQFAMEDTDFVGKLFDRETSYCSLSAEKPEDAGKLYNAQNNPDKRIKDCVNVPISVKDVFVETVTLVKEETGEVNKCPRVVLIDDKGVSYVAVSLGIFSSVVKMIKTFGQPTYVNPVVMMPVLINKGDRSLLSLKYVG